MLSPYKPYNNNIKCFLVKVYDSKTNTTYWLNRCFGNINSVRNSYIHQKYWLGTIYFVYNYPSYHFVETIIYTKNKTRVILNSPKIRIIAGKYKERINNDFKIMD